MSTYVLRCKVSGDNPGEYREEDLDDMTDAEFDAYSRDDNSGFNRDDIESRAIELTGFEWWIEKQEKKQ